MRRARAGAEAGAENAAAGREPLAGDYGSELRDDALKLALLEENKLLPDAQNTLLALATGLRPALALDAGEQRAVPGRAYAAGSPGSWQAQTSVQAEPLSGDKAQTRNLSGDQLAACR
jgi:uncharacterized protein YfaS (alpha-2-macroglobulin family)